MELDKKTKIGKKELNKVLNSDRYLMSWVVVKKCVPYAIPNTDLVLFHF
jgi:hypothetical protein